MNDSTTFGFLIFLALLSAAIFFNSRQNKTEGAQEREVNDVCTPSFDLYSDDNEMDEDDPLEAIYNPYKRMPDRLKPPPVDEFIGHEDMDEHHNPQEFFKHNGIFAPKVSFDAIPYQINDGCKLPTAALNSKAGRDVQDMLDQLHSKYPSLRLVDEFESVKDNEDEGSFYYILANTNDGLYFTSEHWRRKFDIREVLDIRVECDRHFDTNRMKARFNVIFELYQGNGNITFIDLQKDDLTVRQFLNLVNKYIGIINTVRSGGIPRGTIFDS
jgi:hypothetical protein